MKICLYLIISILLPLSLWGKEDIYSALTTAKNDSEKLVVYQNIYNAYKYTNTDAATSSLQKGLSYFTSVKYPKGRARMLDLLGQQYSQQGLTDLAQEKLQQALDIYTAIKDQNGIASVNNGIGVVEGRKSNYEVAIRHFIVALKLYQANGNIKGQANTYLKLGVANAFIGNATQAITYYNTALDLATKGNDTVALVNIYNNLSNVYSRKHDFDTARVYLNKALAVCTAPSLAQLRISPLMNLGSIYCDGDQFIVAMKYYNEAFEIARSEDLPEDYVRLLLNMASATAHKDHIAALDSLNTALQIARSIQQPYLVTEVMGALVDVYHGEKQYDKAFEMLAQQTDLKDSILNLQKIKEIASIQSAYAVDEANEKVTQMQANEHRNKTRTNIIIFIAVELAIALVVLAFFYRRNRKLYSILSRREQELAKANKIKDRLFSIIGHDLRGPVATIPSMVDVYNDPSTTPDEQKFMLDELRGAAVATLETLDKLLSWGKSLIKGTETNQVFYRPAEYMQDNLKLLKVAADQKQLTIINNVPDTITVNADPEQFTFIIRNLVSNAIKFSHPGKDIIIDADTTSKPGQVVFSVTDHGTGIDNALITHIFEPFHASSRGTANETGNGIGLMLCLEFVQENGGSIWVRSEKGKGSTFYFSLKKGA